MSEPVLWSEYLAMPNKNLKHVVIVGAGITGLAAAWELNRLSPQSTITVLESSVRIGGVLQSQQIGEYLVETSADMFSCDPDAAIELCRMLGFEEELLCTNPTDDKAFVGLGSEIAPVPKGFSLMVPALEQPIRDWPLLSDAGKERLLAEVDIQPRDGDEHADEDFHSFAIRRFGVEAFEKLIQPLVSGIYTADPKKLSMKATLKRFLDMEREHGSLITAMAASRAQSQDRAASGARYGLFRAPRFGFSQLVEKIADALGDQIEIRTQHPVQKISRSGSGDGWQVTTAGTSDPLDCDAVIVTTPAAISADVLEDADFGGLTDELRQIESASCAIVTMGIAQADLDQDFAGFGIIYPHIDGGKIIAVSFASNKFDGRAPAGKLLLRFFIGGALQSDLVNLDDDSLVQIALQQLDRSLGYRGQPDFTRVIRWKNAMPQYHLGHVERVERIENLVQGLAGFELAGKSYRGVGIPACIASGKQAANRIAQPTENT